MNWKFWKRNQPPWESNFFEAAWELEQKRKPEGTYIR